MGFEKKPKKKKKCFHYNANGYRIEAKKKNEVVWHNMMLLRGSSVAIVNSDC